MATAALSTNTFSLREARRIALGAQGLAGKRDDGPANRRALRAMVEQLGVLQIDSVNVLARAHLLPGFARLGRYDTSDLHALSYGTKKPRAERAFFEYWAHEASLLPLALHPLFRWRMARAARGEEVYSGLARFGREQTALIGPRPARGKGSRPLAAGEFSTARRAAAAGGAGPTPNTRSNGCSGPAN